MKIVCDCENWSDALDYFAMNLATIRELGMEITKINPRTKTVTLKFSSSQREAEIIASIQAGLTKCNPSPVRV